MTAADAGYARVDAEPPVDAEPSIDTPGGQSTRDEEDEGEETEGTQLTPDDVERKQRINRHYQKSPNPKLSKTPQYPNTWIYDYGPTVAPWNHSPKGSPFLFFFGGETCPEVHISFEGVLRA